MSDDRLTQARAEAREYARPQMLPVQTVSEHREEAFLDGWRAADANPQPRTITRDQARLAKTMLTFSSNDSEADKVFAALGIEVVDDE